jgi:glycosyltransferase involved in cell wall biosynthesis
MEQGGGGACSVKIAWFTPLSRRTGVARYSVSVIDELSKIAHVDVWTTKHEDNYELNKDIRVEEITLDEKMFCELENYDVLVYNTGNNIAFHCEINELCTKRKGITIIHDRVLHHYFAYVLLDVMKNSARYVSIMDYWYGAAGRNIAEQSLCRIPPVWETDDVSKYPLFEELLWNSYGIIVHSGDLLEKIRQISPVPSKHIFHPFYKYQENATYLTRNELNLPANKTILLQYGHITRNKNVHKVLDVFLNFPELRDEVYYVIAGDFDTPYGNTIKKTIQKEKLSNVILMTGMLSDSILHSYINAADICINLRYPSTEGASGSLIEQLYFKKPVIVTRTGFFDEIPDDCIVKLEPPIDVNDLSAAIKHLIKDKEERERLAFNGASFAHKIFSPHIYAKNFMDFVEKVLSCKTSIDFIDNVTDEISRFVSPSTSEYFIDNIAREMSNITDLSDVGHEGGKGEFSWTAERFSDRRFPGHGSGDSSSELPEPLMDRFVNFGWRHRERIKKIPILGAISRKIYHSISRHSI